MPENHIARSSTIASANHTPDVSGSAGKENFLLTALECLLMLEAYRSRGVSNASLPEIQDVDTENIKECLHKLEGMGLLQDRYRTDNKNSYFDLTARGEEVIRQIRTTWKMLMGQPSVSIADIQAAINILT